MSAGVLSYIRGAMAARQLQAQLEQILNARQGRELAQSQEARAQSQEERAASSSKLQEALARAGLLGRTEQGGQIEVPDMGQVSIPGLEQQGAIEIEQAGKRAKATTSGQLEAQIDFSEKLSKKAVADARARLEAAGITSDSPEYGRQLSRLLGIPEEMEIDIAGQKVKLPVKEAVDLLEKRETAAGAMKRTEMLVNARIQAARISADASMKRAARLSPSAQKDIAKLNTAESVFLKIAQKFKPEYVTRFTADPKAATKRGLRVMAGNLSQDEADFRNLVLKEMNEVISDLGGANVPPAELDRLKASLANIDSMTPTEFRSAINNAVSRLRVLRDNYLNRAEEGKALPDVNLFPNDDDDILDVDADGNLIKKP